MRAPRAPERYNVWTAMPRKTGTALGQKRGIGPNAIPVIPDIIFLKKIMNSLRFIQIGSRILAGFAIRRNAGRGMLYHGSRPFRSHPTTSRTSPGPMKRRIVSAAIKEQRPMEKRTRSMIRIAISVIYPGRDRDCGDISTPGRI